MTFSMFFVIFAVLGLQGTFNIVTTWLVSWAFSLSLLTFHVARIVDFRFALARCLPLALITFMLAMNQIYGGPARPYIYLVLGTVVVAYLTITYGRWMDEHENRRRGQTQKQRERRQALEGTYMTEVTEGLLLEAARLDARAGQAMDKPFPDAVAMSRDRVDSARETVRDLVQEENVLAQRLNGVKLSLDDAMFRAACEALEHDLDDYRHRFTNGLHVLDTALRGLSDQDQNMRSTFTRADERSHSYCLYCGHEAGNGLFCQTCGTANPTRQTCCRCGEEYALPVSLIKGKGRRVQTYCMHCGEAYDPVFVKTEPVEPAEPQGK
ncbi:MAG: hypothetical protein AAF492_04440 [Verrucomicrobiota bacterium]